MSNASTEVKVLFLKHYKSAFTPRMITKTADFVDFGLAKNREIRDLPLRKSSKKVNFLFDFDASEASTEVVLFLNHCKSAFTPRMITKTADYVDFGLPKNREIEDLPSRKSSEDVNFFFDFDASHKHLQSSK